MHLTHKQNSLSQLSFAFFKSKLNLNFFHTKATLIAYVFHKLPTPRDVLR